MKTYIPYSLILAAASCGLAFGAETAYTIPVGYVSLGDTTPGQPAVKAGTDAFFSIPLDNTAVFQGLISAISGNEITLTGAAFGDLTTVPHTLRIGTGTSSGLTAMVSSNTATSVTVTLQPGDSLAGVSVGNSASVTKAWTVLGVMGSTNPAGTLLLTYSSSAAQNPAAEGIYEWDGTNWIDTVNTGSPADSDILYPTETLVIRNQSASPIPSFVISGQVPVANSYVNIAASGASGTDNAVSFFGSVDEPINVSGLSSIASPGDLLLGFDNSAPGVNKAAAAILEFDGTDWIDTVNTGSPDNTFPLGGGRGFFFRRAGASAAATWSNQPSYVPSL